MGKGIISLNIADLRRILQLPDDMHIVGISTPDPLLRAGGSLDITIISDAIPTDPVRPGWPPENAWQPLYDQWEGRRDGDGKMWYRHEWRYPERKRPAAAKEQSSNGNTLSSHPGDASAS